jgi:hypothetical protein
VVIDIVVPLCPKVGCRVRGNDFSNLVRSQLEDGHPDIAAAFAAGVVSVSPALAPLAKQANVTVVVVNEPTIPTIELVEFVPTALCQPSANKDNHLPYIGQMTKRIVYRLKEMDLPWKCVGCGQAAQTCIGCLGIGFDGPAEKKDGFYLAVACCGRTSCNNQAEKVTTEIHITENGRDAEKPSILHGDFKRAMEICASCGGTENIKKCAGCNAVGYVPVFFSRNAGI